jgi:hypothetical protein
MSASQAAETAFAKGTVKERCLREVARCSVLVRSPITAQILLPLPIHRQIDFTGCNAPSSEKRVNAPLRFREQNFEGQRSVAERSILQKAN